MPICATKTMVLYYQIHENVLYVIIEVLSHATNWKFIPSREISTQHRQCDKRHEKIKEYFICVTMIVLLGQMGWLAYM
jgi:hypothetical protein